MTLFHFGNCLALAYFPYLIVYKTSKLSEYNSFWACVKSGGVYVLAQLCKMIVLATFFPTYDVPEGKVDMHGELMKAAVELFDLVGLFIIISQQVGRGDLKILVAGVGWATAELIGMRLLPLWVGARGIEFSWKYIQLSFEANISLAHHVIMAALIWMWTRNNLEKSVIPLIVSCLLLCSSKQLLLELLGTMMSFTPFGLLGISVLITLVVGLITTQLYINLCIQDNSWSNSKYQ